MRTLLLAICAVMASMGCNTARRVAQAVPTADTMAPAPPAVDTSAVLKARADSLLRSQVMLARIQGSRIRFETFGAKVKVDYLDTKGKTLEFNAFIRIKRDSAIWASIVAALGIEAFRILITPDSVRVMDKLEKTVRHAAASEMQGIIQLPFDFGALQELILGNPIGLDSLPEMLRIQESSVMLEYFHQGFRHLLTYDTTGPLLRTNRLDENDLQRHRNAILSFDQYQDKSGRSFPNMRRITLTDKEKTDITLDFRQVDFDLTVAFPFSVPRNYKFK